MSHNVVRYPRALVYRAVEQEDGLISNESTNSDGFEEYRASDLEFANI